MPAADTIRDRSTEIEKRLWRILLASERPQDFRKDFGVLYSSDDRLMITDGERAYEVAVHRLPEGELSRQLLLTDASR